MPRIALCSTVCGGTLTGLAFVVLLTRGGPVGDVGARPAPRPAASPCRLAPAATRGRTASAPAARPAVAGRLPLLFAENRGQLPPAARFAAHSGLPLWLTDDGLRIRLTPTRPPSIDTRPPPCAVPPSETGSSAPPLAAAVFLTFENARRSVRPIGITPALTKLHYFLGNDPDRWVTNVPTWTRVRYPDLYPGIDVDVHGTIGVAEYDLVVQPYADIEDVVVRVEGADALRLAPDGSLLVETAAGSLRQLPPHTWEVMPSGTLRPLACAFRLIDATHYGFDAPGRDRSLPLVVDPSLAYSTLLGGNVTDIGLDIAVADDGSAVVVGNTSGNPTVDFPTTPGAIQSSSADNTIGFIAKVSPDGSALEYSTYLGGAASVDYAQAVTVSSDGSITVAGRTSAVDFPTTVGAFDTSLGGLADAFVSRLSADGSQLVFSTFIGGAQGTEGADAGIALDSQGRVCLALSSTSSDFPTTPNAYLSTRGPSDSTVGRLSADGSTLEYSSWAPTGAGLSYGMALAGESRITIVGTASAGLPLTPGAIDTTKSFGEGFIVTMDVEAGTLDYASYLGGSFNDIASGVATDARGALYVTGETESFDFPVTTGAFDTIKAGGYDAFVVKVAPGGSTLEWGTFLGGSGHDTGRKIAAAPDGSMYAVSEATSGFPMTPGAYDAVYNGQLALGLSVLSPDGTHLQYGTYLGGTEEWVAQPNLCLDGYGSAYVTGYTADDLFPTTPGAFDTVRNGFSDSFVAKFQFGAWSGAGPGVAGTGGAIPQLVGDGPLEPGSAGSITLTHAKPLSPATLIVGLAALDAPFKGGTMVPNPLLLLPLTTDASGSRLLSWSAWPSGLPAGTELLMQGWIVDPGGPVGFSASNGLLGVTPGP